jgi:voltage-gated potassium channel
MKNKQAPAKRRRYHDWRVYKALEDWLENWKQIYILFHRESVFKYFFFIIVLMIISGGLFAYFEHERVLAAYTGKDPITIWDKTTIVLYWAIVTIATCGYGDISPGTTPGRIMVIFILFLSVMVVSLFSGNLASALTTKKIMERLRGKGISVLKKQKDLFVVCGWKRNMDALIETIIKCAGSLDPTHMVILANVSDEEINKFKLNPAVLGVNIIQGEYHAESILSQVNLKDSRKIMVLADQNGNETEVDSRSVMTVITIKALAPRAYVCAEILNANYDNYLKMAQCDEIIYSKEYSRILVANAASSVGLAHIIQGLLGRSDATLVTETIPTQFITKKYADLREYFMKDSHTLIGILENTGTLHDMKRHAIREAQKIADMSKLIVNLKSLKTLEGNRPQLNPPADYVIPGNAMAIVIKRTQTEAARA